MSNQTIQTNQIKTSDSEKTANLINMMKPRLRTKVLAELSGLSQRAITEHAANDNIPGAAKHGSLWTFDHDLALVWINEGSKCQKKKKTRKTALSPKIASTGGLGSRSMASLTENLFAQHLKKSRRKMQRTA